VIFFGMKIYTVHIKPEDGLRDKPVFIREGFNLYAFIFTGFWALYHRLWMPLLMIMLFHILTAYSVHAHILLKPSYLAIQLGFNLLVGYQANDWLRARLSRQGYIMADVSAADNLLRAEQRYFERTLAQA
jgi:hypothetical protein